MGWFGWGKRQDHGLPRDFVQGVETVARATRPQVAEEIIDYTVNGVGAPPLTLTHYYQFFHSVSRELTARDRSHVRATLAAAGAQGSGSPEGEAFTRWVRALRRIPGPGRPMNAHDLICGVLELAAWDAVDPSAPIALRIADLVPALTAEEFTAADLLTATFSSGRYAHALIPGQLAVTRLADFEAVLATTPAPMRAALDDDVDSRVAALGVLAGVADPAVVEVFVDLIVAAATGGSAQARDAASPVLARLGESADAQLRAVAGDGKPPQRALAIDALWERGHREEAVALAKADRAGSVRDLVATWRVEDAVESAEVPDALTVPPLPPVRWNELPSAEAQELLDGVLVAVGAALRRRAPAPRMPEGFDRVLAASLLDGEPPTSVAAFSRQPIAPEVLKTLARPEVPLSAVVAVLVWCGIFETSRPAIALSDLLERRRRAGGDVDLRTVAHLLDAADLPGAEIVWVVMTHDHAPLAAGWPDDAVWPLLVEHLDHVLDDARPREHFRDQAAPYRLLATLPDWHPQVVKFLYEQALGTAKTHRAWAQAALEGHPRRGERVTAALNDGRAEIRIAAAEWLAELADPTTLEPLQAAFEAEKSDLVRAAILDTLEALGESVETYLDPDRLLADATRAAKRALPKDASWIPFVSLPSLHWAKDEQLVDPVIVQHLLVQAVRAGSPEPNALLRRYGDLFVTAERTRFAEAVLATWIAQDTAPISPAEAQARARRDAIEYHQWYFNTPDTPYSGKSVDELEARQLTFHLGTPAGSAVGSKGLLAVAAAWGDGAVVGPAERYVHQWYGHRTAQCKALLGMLAWVDDPRATSVLLSIGNRFRTKGIKDEAARLIADLAVRRGWTAEQFADRTVPSVGFDAAGVLRLDYGRDRWFEVTIVPDAKGLLAPSLRDQEGAALDSLPAARRSDDPEAVAEATKAFSAARRGLKAVAKEQRERWQEALRTRRLWSVADWREFLAEHPVLRNLVGLVVWEAVRVDEDQVTPLATFRPLDDGTLVDGQGDAVDLGARVGGGDVHIRIADSSALTAEEVEAWRTHLADADVVPLLGQFAR